MGTYSVAATLLGHEFGEYQSAVFYLDACALPHPRTSVVFSALGDPLHRPRAARRELPLILLAALACEPRRSQLLDMLGV